MTNEFFKRLNKEIKDLPSWEPHIVIDLDRITDDQSGDDKVDEYVKQHQEWMANSQKSE